MALGTIDEIKHPNRVCRDVDVLFFELLNDIVKMPGHNFFYIMETLINAVISDPILGKVIGADFF